MTKSGKKATTKNTETAANGTTVNVNGYEITKTEFTLLKLGKVKLERTNNYLYIQLKMNGKMNGIVSISTSPVINTFCQSHRTIENCICQHCFSMSMSEIYDSHETLMQENSKILQNYTFTARDLALIEYVLRPYRFVRIEAFGDVANDNQVSNYASIINKCKNQYFGWWTKNYNLLYKLAKNKNGWFRNCTLVLSNFKMDSELNQMTLDVFKKYIPKNQLKTFNVFENPDKKQNCQKNCLNCLLCYSKNNAVNIIEKLK